MKVTCICNYCGHTQDLDVWSMSIIEDRKCEKCGDRSKKVRKHEVKDIFGYESQEPKPDAYIDQDRTD